MNQPQRNTDAPAAAAPASRRSRLSPFARVDQPRAVLAWGMYDLANQSFQLVINTLLFGIFLQQVAAADPDSGKLAWGRMITVSMLIVVALSPLVGAIVDARAWKREALIVSGVLAGLLTMSLALIGPGQMWLAWALYVPAAILCGLGENVLAAFLPQLSNKSNIGLVSAIGWTMSYVGAVVLQILVLASVLLFGWTDPSQWRWLFVGAGVWFIAGILPLALLVRETAAPQSDAPLHRLAFVAFARVGATVRDAARHGVLFRFLGVFFVYSVGVQTIIFFATTIATDLRFTTQQLFTLTLVLSLAAGAASVVTARRQDRWGAKRTILIFLVVWTTTAVGLVLLKLTGAPVWVFWVLSLGIGVGLGGIGTSSRAMVGLLTPEERSAEFFGLWGMVYKFAGVVGPLVFSMVYVHAGQVLALVLLAGVFGTGLVLLRRLRGLEQDHPNTNGPNTGGTVPDRGSPAHAD